MFIKFTGDSKHPNWYFLACLLSAALWPQFAFRTQISAVSQSVVVSLTTAAAVASNFLFSSPLLVGRNVLVSSSSKKLRCLAVSRTVCSLILSNKKCDAAHLKITCHLPRDNVVRLLLKKKQHRLCACVILGNVCAFFSCMTCLTLLIQPWRWRNVAKLWGRRHSWSYWGTALA